MKKPAQAVGTEHLIENNRKPLPLWITETSIWQCLCRFTQTENDQTCIMVWGDINFHKIALDP